jgi:hypothetical protein
MLGEEHLFGIDEGQLEPYGQEGVLVQAINVEAATGVLATRYAPERYQACRLA